MKLWPRTRLDETGVSLVTTPTCPCEPATQDRRDSCLRDTSISSGKRALLKSRPAHLCVDALLLCPCLSPRYASRLMVYRLPCPSRSKKSGCVRKLASVPIDKCPGALGGKIASSSRTRALGKARQLKKTKRAHPRIRHILAPRRREASFHRSRAGRIVSSSYPPSMQPSHASGSSSLLGAGRTCGGGMRNRARSAPSSAARKDATSS